MKKIIFAALVALLAAAFVFGQSKIEVLDKYVDEARKTWNVPGMSIVVVQDGKVILSKAMASESLAKMQRSIPRRSLAVCPPLRR